MRFDSREDFGAAEPADRSEIDLPAMGRALARRKAWVLGPAALCLLVSTIGVSVVRPRYAAEAKILIENQESYFTRPDRGDRQPDALPDDEAVQSQVQLVTSRDIARDAIKALNLQGRPEFDPLARGLGTVTRLLVLLGLERDPLRVPPEDRLLSTYYDDLTVFPVVKSRVLSVQFTAQDPDLAARAANTISDLYIALQSGAKRDNAHAAATSLAALIADLKVRAAAAQTAAQEYRAANGLLVGTNNTTITAQQLTDISTQLAQARTAEADAQAKAGLLKDMIKANRIGEVPDVANNDLIRRIGDQRITLQAQLAQLGRTLLPGHPRMQELSAQLDDLNRQMRAAADRTVRTLENEAQIAAGRVDNLQAALDAQKRTATTAGADEVTLGNLELQARLLKEQLEFNTQRYQDAVARESAVSTPADARVISRAIAPAIPAFPKKGPTVAIFTLAGLLLSIGVVISRELLSGRPADRAVPPRAMPVQLAGDPVRAGEDHEVAGPSSIAEPPSAFPRPNGAAHDLSWAADAVETRRKGAGAVCTLVTGAGIELAVAPVALRFGRILARQNRVILLDCGAEPAGLDAALALSQEESSDAQDIKGLRDLLAGESSFTEVIHRDEASRLHIVPLGSSLVDAENEGNLAVVVRALAETYDHVVIATPVPTRSSMARQAAAHADLAILLVDDLSGEDAGACRAALEMAGVGEIVDLDVTDANVGADAGQARSAA